MGEQGTHEQLYEEAQHLWRRRQEIESTMGALPELDRMLLIHAIHYIGGVPPHIVKLAESAIQLAADEKRLVEELGPGWRATSDGILYSPFDGGWPRA